MAGINIGDIFGNSTVLEKLENNYWIVKCNNCEHQRKLKYASIYNLKNYTGCVKCRAKTIRERRLNKENYDPKNYTPWPTPAIELMRQQFICGKFSPKIQQIN